MKKIFSICLILFWSNGLKAQCEVCGLYEGNTEQRWQELRINADSTFEYKYVDKWATLMGGTTTGKWKIIGNQIELNSKYNDEEFEIITKKSDFCGNVPKYLDSICDNLIKIQFVNLKDEYIWFLKSIMINGDTSKVSFIGSEDIENINDSTPMSCFFESESISQINVFNGFYNELEIYIKEEDINYIKIKGNFTDELWYTYIKKEKWIIKKNKLVNNKKFGKFVKK